MKLRTGYKRKLSASAAARCEEAHVKLCFCRCGGRMHGVSHKAYLQREEQLFNSVEKGMEVSVANVAQLVDSIVTNVVQNLLDLPLE